MDFKKLIICSKVFLLLGLPCLLFFESCAVFKTENSIQLDDLKKWLAPVPKQVKSEGMVFLAPPFFIHAEKPEMEMATGWLRDELKKIYGWKESSRDKANCVIDFRYKDMRNNEEYSLVISNASIKIFSADKAGAFRAVGRLLSILNSQIVNVQKNASVICPAIEINDWPDIPMRGMHLQMAFQIKEKLVRKTIEFMAESGFNFVVFEPGGRFESERHPECSLNPFWTKKQLRKLVKHAKNRGLTAIPCINSIGHCERAPQIYMIYENVPGKNIKRPIAMDITHKDFYKTFFEVLDELLEVFDNPPYIQIGTDEFYNAVPVLSRKSGRPIDELYAEFLNRVSGYLAQKGVKAVIWSDMLLSPEQVNRGEPANGKETYKTLDKINKNIIIDYWAYDTVDEYKGMKRIHDRGFQLWASPWAGDKNIRRLCAQAYRDKVQAVLGTTWDCNFPRADAFILTAEYSWNASKAASEYVPYNPWSIANMLFYRREKKLIIPNAKPLVFNDGEKLPAEMKNNFNILNNLTGIDLNIENGRYLGCREIEKVDNLKELENSLRNGFRIMLLNPENSMDGISVSGFNKSREDKELIVYTPAYGKRTKTNKWGIEYIVRNGKVSEISDGKFKDGNSLIPSDGYVLSVHACGSYKHKWVREKLQKDDKISFIAFPSIDKKDSVSVRLPDNTSGVVIMLSFRWPVDVDGLLGKAKIKYKDGKTDSVDIKGSLLKWHYPFEFGNWIFWSAWNCPEKKKPCNGIIALEWKKSEKNLMPEKIILEAFPAGIQSGLTVMGGISW